MNEIYTNLDMNAFFSLVSVCLHNEKRYFKHEVLKPPIVSNSGLTLLSIEGLIFKCMFFSFAAKTTLRFSTF